MTATFKHGVFLGFSWGFTGVSRGFPGGWGFSVVSRGFPEVCPGFFRGKFFFIYLIKKKTRNFSILYIFFFVEINHAISPKIVSVLLSTLVKRFFVSHIREFYLPKVEAEWTFLLGSSSFCLNCYMYVLCRNLGD